VQNKTRFEKKILHIIKQTPYKGCLFFIEEGIKCESGGIEEF